MKKYRIPIFTEEYAVNVVIGKRNEVIKAIAKHTTYSPKTIEREFIGRGICYDVYPDSNPIIGIDGELKAIPQIATIAHEAIHSIDFMMNYLKLGDDTEFRAHGVATILRRILK